MLKKTLLSIVTICALCVSTPGRAQDLDLDEIDIFGDSTAEAPETPPTDETDVFGDPTTDPAASDDPYAITEEADIVRLMEQADQLAADGNCNKAIEIYSAIINSPANPLLQRYAPAIFERAKCFVEVGELQLADQGFDLASQYAGQFPGLFVEALLERGKVMLQIGNFQDALDVFNQAATSNPSDPEVLFLRGKAQVRVAQSGFSATPGGMQDAIKSFKRAIALKEDYVEAYEERAAANLAIGEVDRAIEDYEQAAAIAEANPNLAARRGSAYQTRGDIEANRRKPNLDEVITDYRAAEAAYGKYLETEEGKTEEDYEDAPPETVLPDQVYVSRASLRIALAKQLQDGSRMMLYEQAIDDCNRALEFTEDLASAYFQRAIAERLLGRLDDALESYTTLIEVAPQFEAEAGLRRGIISYYQGDVDSAREDFEDAMEILADGRAAFWTGATYAKQGNFIEAERHYTQAIRENPLYLPAYNNRGLVNMRLGLFAQAFRDFDFLVRKDHRDHVARQRREAARQQMAIPAENPFDYAYDQLPYSSY